MAKAQPSASGKPKFVFAQLQKLRKQVAAQKAKKQRAADQEYREWQYYLDESAQSMNVWQGEDVDEHWGPLIWKNTAQFEKTWWTQRTWEGRRVHFIMY